MRLTIGSLANIYCSVRGYQVAGEVGKGVPPPAVHLDEEVRHIGADWVLDNIFWVSSGVG